MTEETTNNIEETTETADPTAEANEGPEKIEVEWVKALPVIQSLMQKNESVAQLGQLLVEAESKKDAIKDRILRLNESLQDVVSSLRSELEIPSGPEWELDLPEKEGEPGFFVKKN